MGFFLLFFSPYPYPPNNSLPGRPSEIVNGFVGWLWMLLLHSRFSKYHFFRFEDPPLKCYSDFVLFLSVFFLISGCTTAVGSCTLSSASVETKT